MRLVIGDTIEYKVYVGRKKYKTKSGKIVDMTASCCVIDLGKYRDTILKADLATGLVKITNFTKGEEQMPKIEMPSAEYLAEIFEKSGRNISRTAKICEPPISDSLMGKWLRAAGIIPAEGLRAEKRAAATAELPTPVKEMVTATEEAAVVASKNEEDLYSPEAIKKMMEFCIAPVHGRIDKIEASMAALAKLILHNDGKETKAIAVAAELIVQVARRWQHEDCHPSK